MAVVQEQELKTWIDRDLEDSEGERIGTVDGVFYDETTGRSEWLVVDTSMFGTKKSLVPVSMVSGSGDRLVANFTKDHVDETLSIADDETPTEAQQRFLYKYWGLTQKPMGMRWRR